MTGVAARDVHVAQLVGGSATRTHWRDSGAGGGTVRGAKYSEGTVESAGFVMVQAGGLAARPQSRFPPGIARIEDCD